MHISNWVMVHHRYNASSLITEAKNKCIERGYTRVFEKHRGNDLH